MPKQETSTVRDPLSASVARARLLDAARSLFCRHGIHATGITSILEASNVARRTLYEHFGSKENLLRAVFEREAKMWFDWFDVDLPALAADPRTQLLKLFDLLHAWFSSPDFYGCIFINAVAEHDKDLSWVAPYAHTHLNAVRERVLHLAKAADLPHPDMAADQLCLLIDGAIVSAMMSGRPDSALTAQSLAVSLLVRTE